MSDDFVYSQIFEPPEGKWGQVCVASALSADEFFIDKALQTFTKKDEKNRAFGCSFPLYLMLNKGHRLLDKSISGFYQLEPSSKKIWDKIYVQHAKVAVMQFGSSQMRRKFFTDENTVWRLVVCTGNWTEASAKHQIELVWSVDVSAECENELDKIDLLAAVDFLKSLRYLYDCDDTVWSRAKSMLETIEEKFCDIPEKQKEKSRFISTLPKFASLKDLNKQGVPLFNQFCEKIKDESKGFNRIVIGSGFYENAKKNKADSKPYVIEKIDELIRKGNFDDKVKKHIVVNEKKAGQLANWSGKGDWIIHKAYDPSEKNRSLHAKYIFGGKAGYKNVNDGWMYLGSGNLSKQGILSAYGVADNQNLGNIEAGVVFDVIVPEQDNEENVFFEKYLACPKESFGGPLESGDGTNQDEPNDMFIAPSPIMALKKISDKEFCISWSSSIERDEGFIQIKVNNRVITVPLLKKSDSWEKWGFDSLNLPQWVYIEYDNQKYQIPLIDEDGFLVKIKQPIKDLDDFLDLLDDFSVKPVPVVTDEGGDPPDPPPRGDSNRGQQTSRKSYIYSDAMKIIERVATLNNRNFSDELKCNKGHLQDWIEDLKSKIRSFPPELLMELKKINVDFVSVLKNPQGFAPQLNDEALKTEWNDFVDWWSNEWFGPSTEKLWGDG
jgi:hypothetical protein